MSAPWDHILLACRHVDLQKWIEPRVDRWIDLHAQARTRSIRSFNLCFTVRLHLILNRLREPRSTSVTSCQRVRGVTV
jgi:hypothetical protein